MANKKHSTRPAFATWRSAKVEPVSQSEAEQCALVVCSSTGPNLFADNLVGVCSKCGRQIVYRPMTPTTPKKICEVCFAQIARDTDIKIGVTATAAREVQDYFKGKGSDRGN